MTFAIKEVCFRFGEDDMVFTHDGKVLVSAEAILKEINGNCSEDAASLLMEFKKGEDFKIITAAEEASEQENKYKKFILENERESLKKAEKFISKHKKR